jgi:flagellar biosynthesis GTPase FlhF
MYLMQILQMLNKEQRKQFVELFSDLEYELDELGWRGDETTLVNDMLFNHFGLSIEDERQLERFTEAVLDKKKIESAFAVVNMKNNPRVSRSENNTIRELKSIQKDFEKLYKSFQKSELEFASIMDKLRNMLEEHPDKKSKDYMQLNNLYESLKGNMYFSIMSPLRKYDLRFDFKDLVKRIFNVDL